MCKKPSSAKFCEKFLRTLETGSTTKKVTSSDSSKPHTHIFLKSGATGKCRNGDKE